MGPGLSRLSEALLCFLVEHGEAGYAIGTLLF